MSVLSICQSRDTNPQLQGSCLVPAASTQACQAPEGCQRPRSPSPRRGSLPGPPGILPARVDGSRKLTRSSPSVRCSPRRRSPTARSLTQRPPSRLTSSVWKRLHRRSRWSGPPQTAPPHGSPTEAGDEADDEAAVAASGGGEATQRHNTLLTIGREAGEPDAGLRATGRLPERGEARRLYPDGERGLREAGRLEGGAASGSPAPRPAEARTLVHCRPITGRDGGSGINEEAGPPRWL